MSDLIAHRGPDGSGIWKHPRGHVGFAHRRLTIIDLDTGDQPMTRRRRQLDHLQRRDLQLPRAATRARRATASGPSSDTEVDPATPTAHGATAALEQLRGMFAFALWDEREHDALLRARPLRDQAVLLRASSDDVLYFASEVKALLPFLPRDRDRPRRASRTTSRFQFCLAGKTLFKGVSELLPGHFLRVRDGSVETRRYWEVYYEPDFDHTRRRTSRSRSRSCSQSRSRLHLRADVPVGAYLSGGLDSSIVAVARGDAQPDGHGRLHRQVRRRTRRYDESALRARRSPPQRGFDAPRDRRSAPSDFVEHDRARHLPPRLPGRRPRLVPAVHGLASSRREHRKVVLGGQGGDEIFGGYARYLIAYFEQCIKGAIDGTMHAGNFVVTYESIIPNLDALRELQAAAAGVLARRAVRGPRRALLPPDQPRARPRRRGRLGRCSATTRRSRRFRDDLPRRQRRQGVVLRQDDPLRLQDAAAGAAAGRGPREHGARARVARAVPRPPARRARRDDAGRRQVQGRAR